MERTIKSLSELEDFARAFLATLRPNENRATIVGLSGDLGSGKTAFVKALAKELGVKDEILSPTFVIAKFYPILKDERWETLLHIDAYRIEDSAELKPLHWSALVVDPRNLIVIEWPEQLKELFPKNAPVLNFHFLDETTRVVNSS